MLAVCAVAIMRGEVLADTLRSELYQLQLPSSYVVQPDSAGAEPSVYMRVSNADRTAGNSTGRAGFLGERRGEWGRAVRVFCRGRFFAGSPVASAF